MLILYGRKLARLTREFITYNLDILCINEMRWTGNGKIPTKDVTLLYSGHEDQHAREVWNYAK